MKSREDYITDDELASAKSVLMHNMHIFYADSSIGHRARIDAIERFKVQKKIKSDEFEVIAVEADLANDIDVHNALMIESAYEKEEEQED